MMATTRARWLVAGGAVVVAVAIVAAAMMILGSRPVPEAMTYIPRDSLVVAELRPDFPGDQLSRVGNLLAHFPGYKDQSILAQKIDETLARLTRSATNGSVDYTAQVKPWLAGPLFAAILPPGAAPEPSATPDPSGFPSTPTEWLVVATTDGHVRCEDVLTAGGTRTDIGSGSMLVSPDRTLGCALEGRFAILGSPSAVMSASSFHASGEGIDRVADYRTARDRLGADRLATVYVSRAAMTSRLDAGSVGGLASLDPAMTQALAALPAWVMAGIRAEDNALVGDLVSAPFRPSALLPVASPGAAPSLLTAAPAHASQIAALLPADTAVLYEAHGAGIVLQNVLAQVRARPDVAPQLGQVDAALGLLGMGGSQGLVGWIEDAGVVVLPDGSSATGGLVLTAADASTATDRAAQLAGLLKLAGGFGGPGVTITETTIAGTKVTLADFGDASTLLGGLGGSLTIGGTTIPPGTHVVVSIAAHGSAVLIGSGEAFARTLLAVAPGQSLADTATYRTAVGLATARNDGQLYVAAGPVIALAEGAVPASDRARYDSDIKPYLAPLDALLETTTLDASGLHVRLVLTVK